MPDSWSQLSLILGIVLAAVFLAMALVVLWKMLTNQIDLTWLVSEPDGEGKASLSRFQFLVFTFVIAGIFMLLCLESGSFVEVPTNTLILLGISGGSYVASKHIQSQAKRPIVRAVPPGQTHVRETMEHKIDTQTKAP